MRFRIWGRAANLKRLNNICMDNFVKNVQDNSPYAANGNEVCCSTCFANENSSFACCLLLAECLPNRSFQSATLCKRHEGMLSASARASGITSELMKFSCYIWFSCLLNAVYDGLLFEVLLLAVASKTDQRKKNGAN